ncbi:hypothetical protein RFI_08806, partial [Reticulomyxa filosa]
NLFHTRIKFRMAQKSRLKKPQFDVEYFIFFFEVIVYQKDNIILLKFFYDLKERLLFWVISLNEAGRIKICIYATETRKFVPIEVINVDKAKKCVAKIIEKIDEKKVKVITVMIFIKEK